MRESGFKSEGCKPDGGLSLGVGSLGFWELILSINPCAHPGPTQWERNKMRLESTSSRQLGPSSYGTLESLVCQIEVEGWTGALVPTSTGPP